MKGPLSLLDRSSCDAIPRSQLTALADAGQQRSVGRKGNPHANQASCEAVRPRRLREPDVSPPTARGHTPPIGREGHALAAVHRGIRGDFPGVAKIPNPRQPGIPLVPPATAAGRQELIIGGKRQRPDVERTGRELHRVALEGNRRRGRRPRRAGAFSAAGGAGSGSAAAPICVTVASVQPPTTSAASAATFRAIAANIVARFATSHSPSQKSPSHIASSADQAGSRQFDSGGRNHQSRACRSWPAVTNDFPSGENRTQFTRPD